MGIFENPRDLWASIQTKTFLWHFLCLKLAKVRLSGLGWTWVLSQTLAIWKHHKEVFHALFHLKSGKYVHHLKIGHLFDIEATSALEDLILCLRLSYSLLTLLRYRGLSVSLQAFYLYRMSPPRYLLSSNLVEWIRWWSLHWLSL